MDLPVLTPASAQILVTNSIAHAQLLPLQVWPGLKSHTQARLKLLSCPIVEVVGTSDMTRGPQEQGSVISPPDTHATDLTMQEQNARGGHAMQQQRIVMATDINMEHKNFLEGSIG